MDPIRHCPNPACPHRARHGEPATYREGTGQCSDCGGPLAAGKGFLDGEELATARPLDSLCTEAAEQKDALGKTTGEPIVLKKPPGTVSLPAIQLGLGVLIIVVSFYYIHQRQFVAVLWAVAGFVFFFLGVDRLKGRDRRVRTVQPFEHGFVYRAGETSCSVHLRDIRLATLVSSPMRVRAVPVGTLHLLGISFGQEVYRLTSFEPRGGLVPAETDRFVLWARELAAAAARRGHAPD